MIYTEAGLPIYSKCFGEFCKDAFKNPELLSGFLSALQTLPPSMSADLSLDSVKMGSTEMRLSKTIPNNHSIVVGLDENSPDIAHLIFNAVQNVLLKEKFASLEWSFVTGETILTFEEELVNSALADVLDMYGGFVDLCTQGKKCPFYTSAQNNSKGQGEIWSVIHNNVSNIRARISV